MYNGAVCVICYMLSQLEEYLIEFILVSVLNLLLKFYFFSRFNFVFNAFIRLMTPAQRIILYASCVFEVFMSIP